MHPEYESKAESTDPAFQSPRKPAFLAFQVKRTRERGVRRVGGGLGREGAGAVKVRKEPQRGEGWTRGGGGGCRPGYRASKGAGWLAWRINNKKVGDHGQNRAQVARQERSAPNQAFCRSMPCVPNNDVRETLHLFTIGLAIPAFSLKDANGKH